MTNKLVYTYKFVKNALELEGYKLLTDELDYKNGRSKIIYECPKGHVRQIIFRDWIGKYKCRCKVCSKIGINNPNYKGGITNTNLALYETNAYKLRPYEKVYKLIINDLEVLGVHCTYCNKIFSPDNISVRNRYSCIIGNMKGEQRLYCSSKCKMSCPDYGQHKYPKDFKPATSREVQPVLRKLVLERDNWTCQKCGKNKDIELHCHHIEGLNQNPIESADVDNCLTLCKSCHKEVHKNKGCNYYDLRCDNTNKGENYHGNKY